MTNETAAAKERPDYETAREELAALMSELGLTIESQFIPWSKSRNAPGRYDAGSRPTGDHAALAQWEKSKRNGWRSLNWSVKLQRTAPGSKPRALIETEYSAGEAHAPSVKRMAKRGTPDYRTPHCLDWSAAVDYELEHGFEFKRGFGSLPDNMGKRVPILPDSVDVFSGLVQDAQSALDAGDFETFAADFGYDSDSRKAESIYRTCADHALKLASALGSETLQKAADIARRL